MAWWVFQCYGDVHVLPVGDERAHTVPMCWCKPKPEQQHRRLELGTEAHATMFTHNAADPRL